MAFMFDDMTTVIDALPVALALLLPLAEGAPAPEARS